MSGRAKENEKALVFGIDWDGTYTADPVLFRRIIALLLRQLHKVVIVTGRPESQPIVPPLQAPVVYCDGQYKKEAAKRAGYRIDIWIDDEPGHIEPSRKLEW